MKPASTWCIVGNPENRRVALFQQALRSCHLPTAETRSYLDLLTGQETTESIPAGAVVRVDSPGENFAVEKLLLARGADAAEQEGVPFLARDRAATLAEDRGRILFPRQWYLGYMASCEDWFKAFENRGCTLTTSLANLQLAFDKRRCHAACLTAGLPVPKAIQGGSCWDELVEHIRQAGIERVFVKLAHGSSASGVVALYLRRNSADAITSAEIVRTAGEVRLYNSLKIRRYTSQEDLRDLMNAILPHGVHVEEWLPKATIDRRVCDLRVVVIAGEPKQMVVRSSRSPLTNLHLGNRRGRLGEFLRRIPEQQFETFQQTCRRTAQVMHRSLHLGLDILFTPGFRQHYLLEVNAFGDLLPGVLHEGRDTYQTEIASLENWLAQCGRAAHVTG